MSRCDASSEADLEEEEEVEGVDRAEGVVLGAEADEIETAFDADAGALGRTGVERQRGADAGSDVAFTGVAIRFTLVLATESDVEQIDAGRDLDEREEPSSSDADASIDLGADEVTLAFFGVARTLTARGFGLELGVDRRRTGVATRPVPTSIQ